MERSEGKEVPDNKEKLGDIAHTKATHVRE